MKKLLSTLVAAVMTVSCFTACSGKTPAVSDDKIQIVTTIFPAYDWVMNVLGDNPAGAEVTMLLDNGADLHSFQPTAEDILKITTGDMFVYVGGESDEWVDDILKEAVNKEMIVINLMDVLGDSVKEEEMVEGMQAEEHDHDHEDDIMTTRMTKIAIMSMKTKMTMTKKITITKKMKIMITNIIMITRRVKSNTMSMYGFRSKTQQFLQQNFQNQFRRWIRPTRMSIRRMLMHISKS